MSDIKQGILAEFRLCNAQNGFAIGHDKGPQITVYSQQVRALNLVWALNSLEGSLKGKVVFVVGGGIAGVTAASAAALYGATVRILERGEELLHLQRGCHTRYLHPRIYEWPGRLGTSSPTPSMASDQNYRRAEAGLPLLNWSVGTASEVATRILADYHRIELRVCEDLRSISPSPHAEKCRLKEYTSVRMIRFTPPDSSGGGPIKKISWRDDFKEHDEDLDFIILTLGFGIERTVEHLPRRSYWRMDSLTQTALDSVDNPYVVLIAGAGDGGILDVLRAKLKEFDHGGFMDECVLRLQGVRDEVRRIEQNLNRQLQVEAAAQTDRSEVERKMSCDLVKEYGELEQKGWFKGIDKMLHEACRPNTNVIWIGNPPQPASCQSQPLNRILGWRLCDTSRVTYHQGKVECVEVLPQKPRSGCRYEVRYATGQSPIKAHQVVLRIGTESEFDCLPFSPLGKPPPTKAFSPLDDRVKKEYAILYRTRGVRSGRTLWEADIRICACPDPEPFLVDKNSGAKAHRILIWLQQHWALEHINLVEYDLHPEFGAIHRRAIRTGASKDNNQLFRHWAVTRRDFWIRVRCSDGPELGEWLSNAIANAPVESAESRRMAQECIDRLRDEAVKNMGQNYWTKRWCHYVETPE